MSQDAAKREALIAHLNKALAWEKRAETMYSHYAAYVRGIHRLHLKPYFEGEAAESILHARQVREAIAHLEGVAVTDRDTTPIVHTTHYKTMLEEALKTEQFAAQSYQTILDHCDPNDELYDVLQQIFFAEERSVLELTQLLDS
jgi:bacterioferritin